MDNYMYNDNNISNNKFIFKVDFLNINYNF